MKRTAAMIAGVLAVPVLAGSVAASTPASPADLAVAGALVATPAPNAGDTDVVHAAAWARQDDARQLRRAARSADLRTYGTGNTAEEAVALLKKWAREGSGGYPDQCLRLADDAYAASARTSTALAQWSRAKAAGVAHPDSRDIPVGAQMFWRTSNPAGHIATYVGDDKVVTNMPGGSIKIVDWHKLNEWGPYLGWANPYYR